MSKTISDLTRDDWNRLFPVKLVDHNLDWKGIFKRERSRIRSTISSDLIPRIEHFGSSSIPTIKAKPYIDLLIEVLENKLFDPKLITQFVDLGYFHFNVPEREGIPEYSSFAKGYHPDGRPDQVFHIHMCPKGHPMWKQLDFRDYLIADPDRAMQYERLKVDLAARCTHDRGAYVLGKTEFVMETLTLIENH